MRCSCGSRSLSLYRRGWGCAEQCGKQCRSDHNKGAARRLAVASRERGPAAATRSLNRSNSLRPAPSSRESALTAGHLGYCAWEALFHGVCASAGCRRSRLSSISREPTNPGDFDGRGPGHTPRSTDCAHTRHRPRAPSSCTARMRRSRNWCRRHCCHSTARTMDGRSRRRPASQQARRVTKMRAISRKLSVSFQISLFIFLISTSLQPARSAD
jgi:hypothetical protein